MAVDITVIGSFFVGITIGVPRMPVPGEALIGSTFDLGLGGKGTNQAIGAARQGANVNLFACVGNDVFGQMAIKGYEKENIHKKAPRAVLFRHTDGAVYDVIPDLIEACVNVLNPVQTSAKGMDQYRLKRAYGDQITFHGAIEKMEYSREECVDEVKGKIDAFAKGGGYILASCNHMVNVPPENIIAIFETAHECGRY